MAKYYDNYRGGSTSQNTISVEKSNTILGLIIVVFISFLYRLYYSLYLYFLVLCSFILIVFFYVFSVSGIRKYRILCGFYCHLFIHIYSSLSLSFSLASIHLFMYLSLIHLFIPISTFIIPFYNSTAYWTEYAIENTLVHTLN